MPPHSRTSARVTGYVVVLCAFALIVYLAACFLRGAVHTGRTVRVYFPEISTLSAGDPVVERGVPVGTVDRIVLENGEGIDGGNGDRPVVVLRLDGDRFVAEDARFLNFSHSLMGARKVWLEPGVSARPLDISRPQVGVFVPGLPEALHKVRDLTRAVAQLRGEAERAFGDSNSPTATALRLDSAFASLGRATAGLDATADALRAGSAALAGAGARTRGVAPAVAAGVAEAERRAAAVIAALDAAQRSLEPALAGTERLVAMLEDSAGAARLLRERDAYDALLRHVETLEAAARLLRAEGLGDSITVRPRRKR